MKLGVCHTLLNLELILCYLADCSPRPITPDYGGPLVCYADGVFDFRFNRYVTVREGMKIFELQNCSMGQL